ncbi:MAG: NtaA/DmoA family FMN-dependent monooxygenase [Microbacterium sp.]
MTITSRIPERTDVEPGARLMRLNLFMKLFGHHPSAWQREGTALTEVTDPDVFVDYARICERGLFDAVFLADTQLAMWGGADVCPGSVFEPSTLLAYVAARTERIGLIGTVSSSLNDPVNVARSMASLDLISGGRVGINLVTSQFDAEALLHGMDALLPPVERYARAREFAEVLMALWDSYPTSVCRFDKENAEFFDPTRFRPVDHSGRFFRIRGVVSTPPSPQGRPILVQAGASPEGRDLAARYAEAIYGIGSTIDDAREYYEDIKLRTRRHGREEEAIAVLPGCVTIIGDTHAEAVEKKRYLDSLKPLPRQLATLSAYIGMDCSGWDPDDLMPELPPIEDFPGPKGRYVMMQTLSHDDGRLVTVGEMLSRISAGGGHFTCVGTAVEVADELVRWFESRAADGFNINASTLPEGIEDFVDKVVPELQERGVFRTEYAATTLRGHLSQRSAVVA